MSCSDDGLTASDIQFSKPITMILGAVKRIALNVYQKASDDNMDGCGGCGTNDSQIVIPPTITITDAEVDIYKSPDSDTIILTGTASVTNILDDESVLIGYKITYMIDTSTAPLNVVGEYMLVLKYTTSAGEVYPNIMYFNVFKQAFVGNC
jgi:hypothetical protein